MRVDFYRHALSADDVESLREVVDSPFLTTGPVGRRVEGRLCDFFDVPHALLTNSWTNGALAALLAMEVGPGDEVIVPAMTFIASANVVELLGARAVFVDVDPDTLLMWPDTVVAALTPRTRAVIPVHLYGQMCDMRGLREALDAAGRGDVRLIEDAAHCFEGTRAGDPPGRHSDAAIFSFYATKNVTCGEGGAIVTRDGDLYRRLQEAYLHGMSQGAADRYSGGRYRHWDMPRLGVKANLPDLLAALLPQQIDAIRDRRPERRRLADRYRAAFADGPLRLVGQVPDCESAEHLFTFGVPQGMRDRAIDELNAAGIGVTVNYRSVPTLAYYHERYGYGPGDFPVSYEWGEATLTLPLYPGLRDDEQAYVIEAVRARVYPLCRSAA